MKHLYHSLANLLERKFRIDAHYFMSGGFWLLAAQATTIAASLLATVFMTKILSPQEFGIYRYIIGLGLIFGVFSLTGIGQAITQATAKGLTSFYYQSLRPTLSFSLIITLLSSIASAYYYVMDNQILALGCLIVGLLQPWTQLFGCTMAYLQGSKEFKKANHVQTVKSFFVSGSTIAALFISTDILWLLTVFFSTQVIASIYAYYLFLPKKAPGRDRDNEAKSYFNFAKHTSFRNIIDGLATKIDSVLIFQWLGASELALYTIAALIPDQIRGGFKNILTLLIPKFTRHKSLRALQSIIPTRSLQFLILLSVITILFIAMTPFLYDILFPNYSDAILYTQLLALSFPASIYLIPFSALQTQQREKRLYAYHIIVSIVQICSLLLLIPLLGLIGAVVARIITQYSRAIISFWILYRD